MREPTAKRERNSGFWSSLTDLVGEYRLHMLAWNCTISYANLLFLNFHWICRDQNRSRARHQTVLGEAATWRPIPEFSSCEEVKVHIWANGATDQNWKGRFRRGFKRPYSNWLRQKVGEYAQNLIHGMDGMDCNGWFGICHFVCEMDHEMEGPFAKAPMSLWIINMMSQPKEMHDVLMSWGANGGIYE